MESERSVNFEFLKERFKNLYTKAFQAEQNLIKNNFIGTGLVARQSLELVIQYLYESLNINDEKCKNLCEKINNEVFLSKIDNPKKVSPLMNRIRILGNSAAHETSEDPFTYEDSLKALNKLYNLSIWFYKFVDPSFKHSDPFRDPCFFSSNDNNKTSQDVNPKRNALFNVLNAYTQHFLDKQNKEPNYESTAIQSSVLEKNEDKKLTISDVFKQYNLTADQSEMINKLQVFLETKGKNIFLLKGYAGTGKTFLTKGITEYLTAIGRDAVLCAPTGKASRILELKSQYPASTIHNTIYYAETIKERTIDDMKGSEVYKFYFKLSENNHSTDTVYIVDEASMVSNNINELENIQFGSGRLLDDLFDFINFDHNDHNKKIIFIGDSAQLPPVGYDKKVGSPALNEKYIRERYNVTVDSFELKEIVRQKSESGVIINSQKLRQSISEGLYNHLDFETNDKDIFKFSAQNFLDKYYDVTQGNRKRNTVVLAYKNSEVFSLNNSIRQLIINNSKNFNIYVDRIPPIQNNEILIVTKTALVQGESVKNGEIIEVETVDSEIESVTIKLKIKDKEGKVSSVPVELQFQDLTFRLKKNNECTLLLRGKFLLNNIFLYKKFDENCINRALYIFFKMRHRELDVKTNPSIYYSELRIDPYFNAVRISFGYAMTVHKSQGSEWENVFIYFDPNTKKTNENYFRWMYTAVTRSSKKLFLINPPRISVTQKMKF